VKSAARVLLIFEYFEKMRSPRTLSEIAHDMDYPVSSTLALLRSINSMGYLNYDSEKKTYSPSIRFSILGEWIRDQLFEGSAIEQMMEHLATITQESVLLGTQNGLRIQQVRIVHTAQSLSYAPPVGTWRPLLRSSAGRVLLSKQSEEEVVKAVERINALGSDEGRVFDIGDVLKDIRSVRKNGYSYSSNVFVKGAAIVSVALPEHAGIVPMAISVAGPTSRVDKDTIPELLDHIHAAIEEFLGDARSKTSEARSAQ
tara:strand:- start:11280 stop:12050 length:771 start_codon:yes stop_codon:yes gene_type:complete